MSKKSRKVTTWEDDDIIGDGFGTPVEYMREDVNYNPPRQFKVKRGPFYAVDGPAYAGLYAACGRNAYGIEFIVMTAKPEDLTRVWNSTLTLSQINWKKVRRVAVIRDEDLQQDLDDVL